MKQITPVIIAEIRKKNQFLLTKRIHLDYDDNKLYHGAWQLPGGGLEFGESPEQTLHREIMEEVGVKIKIIKLFPKIYTEVRKNWQGIFIVYVCELNDDENKIVLNDEASEYGWFTLDQAMKLKTLPSTIEMIKDAQNCGRGES